MMVAVSLVVKATSILAVALVASRLLRRTGASTCALILTSAFGIVLALPVMEVALPSRPIEVELPRLVLGLELTDTTAATDAVAPPEIANSLPRGSSSEPPPLPQLATMVWVAWGIGVLLLLGRLGVGLVSLRSLRQTGERWDDSAAATILRQTTSRRVHLFLHSELASPMTCGIAQPAIGLPAEARDWSPAELQQALIHEVEHIRRGDWLVLVLSRVVCSLYWFHPLAWIAARRLHLESEYACDDAVVRVGQRATYAQQLVSMARRLSADMPRPALSMAGRCELAKRVDAVLSEDRPRTQLRTRTVAAATLAALVVTAAIAPWRPAAAQPGGAGEDVLPIPTALADIAVSQVLIGPSDATGTTRGENPAVPRPAARQPVAQVAPRSPATLPDLSPATRRSQTVAAAGRSFEAASIRLHRPNGDSFGYINTEPGGRFVVMNMPLQEVVEVAFGIRSFQLLDAPDWIQSARYDITALTGREEDLSVLAMQPIIQTLLADRFQLDFVRERRITQRYALVRTSPDGLGPQIRPTTTPCMSASAKEDPTARACGLRANAEGLVGVGMKLDALAMTLTRLLNTIVQDQTGLTGLFDFTVRFNRESTAPDGVSILAAIQEQLGLKLEQAPVDVIVVKRIERPIEK